MADAETAAGGLEEAHVEAVRVVGDESGTADEPGELPEDVGGRGSGTDVGVGHAGVGSDEGRDGATGVDVGEEGIALEAFAVLHAHRGDLDNVIAMGAESGGFKIEDDPILGGRDGGRGHGVGCLGSVRGQPPSFVGSPTSPLLKST